MGRWFLFALLTPLVRADEVCSSASAPDDECFSTLQINRHTVGSEEILGQNDDDRMVSAEDDPCTCLKAGIYATADEARHGDIDKLDAACGGMCVLNGFGQCRNAGINGQAKVGEDHVRCRERCIANSETGRDGRPIDPCVAVEVRLPNPGETKTSCEFYRDLPTTTKKQNGQGHRCWIRTPADDCIKDGEQRPTIPTTPAPTQQPTPVDPQHPVDPIVCCQAETATCKACQTGGTIEDTCRKFPQLDGCSNQQCKPQPQKFNLPHKSCPEAGNRASCVGNNRQYKTFEAAWAACGQNAECGMIMRVVNQKNKKEKFYMRRTSDPDLARDYHKSMLYECPVTCPKAQPVPGSACPKHGLRCDYTPVACAGGSSTFSTTAECSADGWLVQEQFVACPDPDPGNHCEPPAEKFDLPVKSCPERYTNKTTCVAHNRKYSTFAEAWAACDVNPECGVVTKYEGIYYLRRLSDPDIFVHGGGHGSGSILYSCPDCPTGKPKDGDSCSKAGLLCEYDPSPCNGYQHGHYQSFASCGPGSKGGLVWNIGEPHCPIILGFWVGPQEPVQGPVQVVAGLPFDQQAVIPHPVAIGRVATVETAVEEPVSLQG